MGKKKVKEKGMRLETRIKTRFGDERMDANFSVFNGHVNKAGELAMSVLDERFPDWAVRIRELDEEGNGIMHIFNVDPEPATAAYVALVTAFVNGPLCRT